MRKFFSALTAIFMALCGCSGNSVKSESQEVSAYSATESYTADDLVVLQDFLLGRRTTGNGKDFDLNNDGRWDVFDLCLLKHKVMKNLQEENSTYDTFKITANSTTYTAKFADNSSADALCELLKNGDITIDMSDYGNFEKVGNLGVELPRNDEQITTEPGDIILYQGDKITIYYDKNSWNFTRLGKINNVTQDELKAILGDGDVTVTLSLA